MEIGPDSPRGKFLISRVTAEKAWFGRRCCEMKNFNRISGDPMKRFVNNCRDDDIERRKKKFLREGKERKKEREKVARNV